MSAVTLDQLREAFEDLIAQINKANTKTNAIQQLLTLESAELLIANIQHVGTEHLAVLGLLMDKAIITGAEVDAKKEEMKAQWLVESALDPHLAELTVAAAKRREGDRTDEGS